MTTLRPTSKNSTDDMLSLLDFRKEISSDPRGFLRSWNTTAADYCSWNGVTCSRTHPGRVIELNLSSQSLHGRISPSLGNLTFLRILDLSYSNFFGQLPLLSRLVRLQDLILNNNQLQSLAPDAFMNCYSLYSVALSSNMLAGPIPLPASIGSLSNLMYLYLDVGKLSNRTLQYLRFGKNNLLGAVPESIGNLIGLNELVLELNNLTGPIGSWVVKLNNLVKVSLSDNNFSGPIPSSIGGFTQLTNLHLQNNSLDGPIPLQVSNLQQLIELDISSNKLEGEIPYTLSECRQLNVLQMDSNFITGNISPLRSLTSLNMINLSHNMLSGIIPAELGGMSSLTQLDLSYNDLQGKIPMDGVFRNASAVSLVGNSRLCGGLSDLHMPPCPIALKEKAAQYYIIRVLIPIFGFMSLLMLVCFVLTKKRTAQQSSISPLGDQFPIVSYNDLVQATNTFSNSNLIGRGGCGSVYRGNLMENNLKVAIKVLDSDMPGVEKSFLAECEALRNIRHRNLVPIITTCSRLDIKGNVFKALVYEFMPNGNLDSWLHQQGSGNVRKPLDLNQRTSLATNIANVLDYLHNECGKTIIHCDVKPSNILLDDDMNARLGDFGIAKLCIGSMSTSTGDSEPINSTGMKGTIGYMPPEYARGGHASTCGDVYSFGIVLLEMLTGRRPTDHVFVDELNIVKFVERSFPDKILDVIDGSLRDDFKSAQINMVTESETYRCLFSLLQVALSCTREIPGERTTMEEATSRIGSIKTTYARGIENASRH
ncbi:putative LRR receptor-like serine/threonine-protein kinase [Zea mays]|uniref:Receptor kinase-like protein Xa21 n=1 Tax=Zea mays TaxID=4577 RepID=A0A3L6G2T1_MAIZE|nr:putative LRR receptor-like serine/threonine-protein kinase [Zea mays]